jgi:hypothetical protein
VWNLRLELGLRLEPTPVRTTEFAPALSEAKEQQPPAAGYGKPTVAVAFKVGRFSGKDFTLQPDGTLRCPADQKLLAHERRREADGSLRVVYGASIRSCRSCPLREQCQWNGTATAKPRQVSVRLASAPGRSRPLALARLEPQSPPARLHAARAAATYRGRSLATGHRVAAHHGGGPLSRTAGALASLVGTAARSQCAPRHDWTSDDPIVRRSSSLCHFARFSDGVTPLDRRGSLFSDKFSSPRGAPWLLFLAGPHLLFAFAFFLLMLLVLPSCWSDIWF